MSLSIAPVDSGKIPLGQWGTLWLTGQRQAVVRSLVREDFEVPPEVAEEIPWGVAVLADEVGRLLLLPYSGEVVACMNLSEGDLAYPLLSLPRRADESLRMAAVNIVPHFGVLYLTEMSLCFFNDSLDCVWSREGDFMGWAFEGVQNSEILLGKGDPSIGEEYQSISLVDGSLLL